jgi:hypothetical protein
MNELQMFALYRMSEHDRRTTEENAGRMFAAMVTAFRRVRKVRTRAATVLQTVTR